MINTQGDTKIAAYGEGKVIPSEPILTSTASERLASHLRAVLTDKILQEARLDDQLANALQERALPLAEELEAGVTEWLEENPDSSWRDYVDEVAADLAKDGGRT